MYYPGGYNRPQQYDIGYIIYFVTTLLVSVVGNSLFLVAIKKNQHLHTTPHWMMTSMAIRDLITALLVIPFVMDSQAAHTDWQPGDGLCKLYSYVNYGMMAIHAMLLIFVMMFLYFRYRKQESYMNEDGAVITRKTRMHKWAIPLAWVIGLSLAIPIGALAKVSMNINTGHKSCSVWDMRTGIDDTGYKVSLSYIFVGFFLPVLLLMFPVIALLMQLCGVREPKLGQPHSRLAITAITLVICFLVTQGPFHINELVKLFRGAKGENLWAQPRATGNQVADKAVTALLLLSCALNPIFYFVISSEYRQGMITAMKNICSGKTNNQGSNTDDKNSHRSHQTPIIKQQSLKSSRRQPQVISSNRRHYLPNQPQHLRQPLIQHNQILFPEHHLPQGVQFLPPQPIIPIVTNPGDLSFERLSPQLPAVFEYNDFKYIDTARVEPRIAYSPEKTPPKTPETPHFGRNPFPRPVTLDDKVIVAQANWQATNSNLSRPSSQHFETNPTSERQRRPSQPTENFELENLDGSPGNTLRDRRRLEELHSPSSPTLDTIEVLQESPGTKSRLKTSEIHENEEDKILNGKGSASLGDLADPSSPSQENDSTKHPSASRTRSRTDLCPEVPRSKYEHSV